MEVAYDLLTNRPEMSIADVAREVGFTAPNLREQFKRCYGITPAEYRAGLIPPEDPEEDV
jgi:AraC-like DNA-binding protein